MTINAGVLNITGGNGAAGIGAVRVPPVRQAARATMQIVLFVLMVAAQRAAGSALAAAAAVPRRQSIRGGAGGK